MDKRLIKLARMSPSSYAKTIKRRALSLLKSLEEIKKKKKWNTSTPETFIGCPHCKHDDVVYLCYTCLWTECAEKPGMFSCCGIPFNGILYKNTDIIHTIDSEYLYDVHKYENTKKYLLGKIKWAELKCWGKEYKKRKQKNGQKTDKVGKN